MKRSNITAQHFFKRLTLVSLQALIIICLLVITLAIYKDRSDKERRALAIKKIINEHVSSLDYKIESIKKLVNINRHQLESMYSSAYKNEFLTYLANSDSVNFSLDELPDSLRMRMGNIVGSGILRERLKETDFYKEIQAQLSIGSLFQSVYSEFPDLAWVYTISKNDFIHMYPFSSSVSLQYSKSWLDYDIFLMGLPENNPERKIYVTPVYLDAGGKGLMISIGASVYYDNLFRSITGADLTIAFLSDFVSKAAIDGGELMIVNELNQLVAHPSAIESTDTNVKVLADVLPALDWQSIQGQEDANLNGRSIFTQQMKAVPWRVIFVTTENSFLISIINEYYFVLVVLLVVIFCLIFFTYVNYIRPSLQLVSFIEKCTTNVVSMPTGIHLAWKGWFGEVYQSFKRKEDVISQLDFQVHEKAKALEKANEELKQQHEALTEANMMKDRIFSIVSHDLRSPISSLIGMLSILNRGGISQQELSERFVEIESRAKKLNLTLENILQWSLCNLNAYSPQSKLIDLNRIIQENIDLLESTATDKNLQIQFSKNTTAPIRTDRNILDLVLRNLIYNAIKFSYANGKVEIHYEVEQEKYTIHVKDYGKGIPEHMKEKLFCAGKGLQNGTYNEKGTGLGLRLSKEFLEKIGGDITFRSTLNEGTTFSVILKNEKEVIADEQQMPNDDEGIPVKKTCL